MIDYHIKLVRNDSQTESAYSGYQDQAIRFMSIQHKGSQLRSSFLAHLFWRPLCVTHNRGSMYENKDYKGRVELFKDY